jgi:uncharacterized protein
MLMNARTGEPIATDVEMADTRAARRKGLLGRDGLEPTAALILLPCFSVHTISMRFPIDVIFLDKAGVVLRVVKHMAPGRMAVSFRAHAVVELAADAPGARDVAVGDRLYLSAQRAAAGTCVSWPIPA